MQHQKPLFNFLLNRELDGLYLTVALKTFAWSITGIFIPIYLFNLNYSFREILIFFLITFGVFLLLTMVLPKIINKIGLKKTMVIAIPFYVLYFFSLSFINGSLNWLFFTSAFLVGIAYAFFWIPFHSDFTLATSKKIRATETGIQYILIVLFEALGPLLGGFLTIKLGFNYILLASAGIMLIGLIPLLMTKEFKETKPGTIKDMFRFLNVKNSLGFFAYGSELMIASVIWPLFIILILKGYFLVGVAASIPLIVNIISIFFTTRIADKKGSNGVMKIGTILLFFDWMIRIFITQAWQVFSISVYNGLVEPSTKVCTDSVCYDRARKSKVVESIAGREFAINVGRIVTLLLLLIWPNFIFAFIIAALSALLYPIFALKDKKSRGN